MLKFVQELLLDGNEKAAVTAAAISEQIDLVLKMKPSWGADLDRTAVTDELIRRFSLWIGKETTMASTIGHVAWLNADRKQNWRYWQRYRDWMEEKLSWTAVDALDRSTDTILGFLEDPLRADAWDRRGLVVGHVQSGKTGSYTGLICKAADAGYKIIVVLAGLHNNLRSQTQIRLDEGFLGFATTTQPGSDAVEYVGAGRNGRDAGIRPNCATNRSDAGDFNKRIAKHLAITPEQRPWLFVVKKNKSVLTLLLDWIRNHAANVVEADTGRRIVTHLPLLVIDDEADHASVDTGGQAFDEEGNPDEEHEPKVINSLIRRILNAFSRSAYVGYTATPFANIFIHERGATFEEGPDLFPAAFIVNLAAPSNYVGPARVFGLTTAQGRQGGLPLVRRVKDQESAEERPVWMPVKHKVSHRPRHEGRDELPPSLVEAIDAFLIACAVRLLRGQLDEHSSMLIHVTRFTYVQQEVHRQVSEHVRQIRQRVLRGIDAEEVWSRLHTLWQQDFVPTTAVLRESLADDPPDDLPSWEAVVSVFGAVCDEVNVQLINGTAKAALDYANSGNRGLTVIAIGGDKLARGLTLEGLCCSYFLRASRMYDTLMQMGRWFGYRPGYLDLCRLYTTQDLTEWFGHIADAAEELREEFNFMAASGLTPREFGLKVQSHPVLMITSQLKMRSAQSLYLSFSGQRLQTVALFRQQRELQGNARALWRLLESIGKPSESDPSRQRGEVRQKWAGSYLWTDVAASKVIAFLSEYTTHPAARRVNCAMLSAFIELMSRSGELTEWTIALMGTTDGEKREVGPGVSVRMNRRSGDPDIKGHYSIKVLLDPTDEAIDLSEEEWNAALAVTRTIWQRNAVRPVDESDPKTPSSVAVRQVRGVGAPGITPHPERGVLILYVLDPEKAYEEVGSFPADTPPIVAFGISFPASTLGDDHLGLKVEYKVNNVLWEQEYGSAD
ncbi:Z1 domain-containing protein [Planctellipticum variicoloris]|nr:Z1 domain-containing protein [Planctomycetaceae bacterium SH412]